jgi:hypothetical protein
MLRRFFFISILFLSACASQGSITLDDLDASLVDLTKLVQKSLPLGKRKESENGRVFSSEYFIFRKGEYERASDAPIRSFAEIYILGDRRPYKIETRVIVERRDGDGDYSLVKYDEGQARVITRRMQSALHKRRDDRNIIDDFRVF